MNYWRTNYASVTSAVDFDAWEDYLYWQHQDKRVLKYIIASSVLLQKVYFREMKENKWDI